MLSQILQAGVTWTSPAYHIPLQPPRGINLLPTYLLTYLFDTNECYLSEQPSDRERRRFDVQFQLINVGSTTTENITHVIQTSHTNKHA